MQAEAGCNAGTLTARSLVEAAARDVQAKGRHATLEQQRLTARLGGSCREGIGGFLGV